MLGLIIKTFAGNSHTLCTHDEFVAKIHFLDSIYFNGDGELTKSPPWWHYSSPWARGHLDAWLGWQNTALKLLTIHRLALSLS